MNCKFFYACLFTALSLVAHVQGFEEQSAPAGSKSRKFHFVYSATLPAGFDNAKSVDLWLPVPQDSAYQTITNLNFEGPRQPDVAIEPQMHNKIAHWKLDADEAKNLRVRMSFDCVRAEIAAPNLAAARALNQEELTALDGWLKPNTLVTVGGAFEKTAADATQGASQPAEIARKAYDYTVSHMKYDKPKDKLGWGRGSTQWACDEHFGNCTDFHALFMSIARTKGVPVKFEMGFPLPTVDAAKPLTHEGSVEGYHCWAKFYLGGIGWVPIDASEAQKNPGMTAYYFGNLTPDRVQMSSGRDVDLVPKQAGASLNYFIYPYAEADGKKIPVAKLFSFKDLN